jgi:nucleoid-associated protein YgaU
MMPATPSSSFLTSKAGPLPVYAWAGLGLGAAYLYSRHKASQAAATAATTSSVNAAGEPVGGQPTYLIENNIPSFPYSGPSAPVPVQTPVTPVVGPPSTKPSPPTTTPLPVDKPPTNKPPAPPVSPGPVSHPSAPPPVTAPKPPTPTPVQIPGAPHVTGETTYRAQAGDTLSSIAAKYKIPGGWQALWAYNLNPANNSAQQIATLKQRGPNLIYSGETIRVPEYS